MPAAAVGAAGVPGAVAGVAELEASEGAEGPTSLLATTVKVYAVPFVKPETLQFVDGAAAGGTMALLQTCAPPGLWKTL